MQSTTKPIYIALDFDGVLHHELAGPTRDHCLALGAGRISCDEFVRQVTAFATEAAARSEPVGSLFDRADLLGDAIDRSEAVVRFVIATSWRNSIGPADMEKLLPPRLHQLVVGTLDRNATEPFDEGSRGRLMQKWIGEHAPGHEWYGLDDATVHWTDHRDRLIKPSCEGIDVPFARDIEAFLVHRSTSVVG